MSVWITLEGVYTPGEIVAVDEVDLGTFGFVEVEDGWLSVFEKGEAPDVAWTIDVGPADDPDYNLLWPRDGRDIEKDNWAYRARRVNIMGKR